jgi:aminoglycoside 6'-N-acetyltransferase I
VVSGLVVRLARPADKAPWALLRAQLWPDASVEEHASDIAAMLARGPHGGLPLVAFVAEAPDGVLAGFLEVGLRSHADGCDPRQHVGFVEGWFVLESHRRKGVGKHLLQAAEDWARSQGCVEMASDTWVDHHLSQRVHEALRFEVVDRCVHYRKRL